MTQSQLQFFFADQSIPLGIGQFIQIHHPYKTVGVDDNVSQKVCEDVDAGIRIIGMRDDIALPADQLTTVVVEFADFETSLQKITGVAMVQSFFGVECIPTGNNDFIIPMQDDVIFQIDAFFRNNAPTVKFHIFHGIILLLESITDYFWKVYEQNVKRLGKR